MSHRERPPTGHLHPPARPPPAPQDFATAAPGPTPGRGRAAAAPGPPGLPRLPHCRQADGTAPSLRGGRVRLGLSGDAATPRTAAAGPGQPRRRSRGPRRLRRREPRGTCRLGGGAEPMREAFLTQKGTSSQNLRCREAAYIRTDGESKEQTAEKGGAYASERPPLTKLAAHLSPLVVLRAVDVSAILQESVTSSTRMCKRTWVLGGGWFSTQK